MKSIVVDYDNICAICGRPKEATHHLIFGQGLRKLADEDGITIPICNACHNMQLVPYKKSQIHDNSMAESLSKMCGQLAWEHHKIASELAETKSQLNNLLGDTKMVDVKDIKQGARAMFKYRYGRSYI